MLSAIVGAATYPTMQLPSKTDITVIALEYVIIASDKPDYILTAQSMVFTSPRVGGVL